MSTYTLYANYCAFCEKVRATFRSIALSYKVYAVVKAAGHLSMCGYGKEAQEMIQYAKQLESER